MPERVPPGRHPPKLFLKEWRERADGRPTQEDVAARIGVSGVTVSRWETGERQPDMNAQAAFARAVGCHLIDLHRHPGEDSADALLRGQPAEIRQQAIKIIKALLQS